MDEATKHSLKGHLAAINALRSAMDRSISSTAENHWRYVGFRDYMAKYQRIAEQVSKLIKITAPIGSWDLSKVGSVMDTIGVVQRQYFEAVYANLSILGAFVEHSIGAKEDEIRALSDFFQANLRKAVFDRPERERNIQDVVEQLLIGKGLSRGLDYEREKGRVKVSIKETVPDFIIRKLSLAIEVKLSRDSNAARQIVDEMNADIQAYGKAYSAIIFVVYDLGSIQNEVEFRQGIASPEQNIHVAIIKH